MSESLGAAIRTYHSEIAFDGAILMFWDSGLNTAEIGRRLQMRESIIANRLAEIRDAAAEQLDGSCLCEICPDRNEL